MNHFGRGVVKTTWNKNEKQKKQVADIEKYTKLELVRYLFLSGWKAVEQRQLQTIADSDLLVHIPTACRSKAHLCALAHHARIFASGAPAILHGRPEAYYLCLLRLADYTSLLALDCATASSADFLAVLRDQGVPALALAAPAEEGELLAIEDGDGGSVAHGLFSCDFALPPLVAGSAHIHEFAKATMVIAPQGDGAPEVQVRWDNWSHTTLGPKGFRRAYIACRAHKGDRCFKYVKEGDLPSNRLLCAWLVAWEAGGIASGSKAAHRWFVPSDSEVQRLAEQHFSHVDD